MSSQPQQNKDDFQLEREQGAAVLQRHLSLNERMSNPFPWYKQMREEHPVSYNEEGKFWEVFRYADVQQVVNTSELFSSEQVMPDEAIEEMRRKRREQGMEEDEGEFGRSLLNTDPPRHRQLRSLVTQAFTPRTIAQLTPRISELVQEQLDKVAEQGRMDIIGDLSYPLPVIVIAEMLGIPAEDREQFKRWSDMVVGTEGEEAEVRAAVREMNQYFKAVLAERRKQPKKDLISDLIAAEIAGEKLTEQELLSFCILLLVAGNETTTNLIGNALLCFDEQPEVMDEMRNDPTLIPGAIEEVLRYRSPVQLLARAASRDVVFGGKEIKAGQIVIPSLGSANRDEAQFPNADRFDIRRNPNRHVGFGHGIHFCVGAPLARLETKISLEILFKRFQDIKRDRSVEVRPIASTFVYGVKNLPVTFRNL